MWGQEENILVGANMWAVPTQHPKSANMLWTCQDGQGHLKQQGAAREGFLEEGAAGLRGEEEPAEEWEERTASWGRR